VRAFDARISFVGWNDFAAGRLTVQQLEARKTELEREIAVQSD